MTAPGHVRRPATFASALGPQHRRCRPARWYVGRRPAHGRRRPADDPRAVDPVPITGQTFAELLVAATLGMRLGVASRALYVASRIGHPNDAGAEGGRSGRTGSTAGDRGDVSRRRRRTLAERRSGPEAITAAGRVRHAVMYAGDVEAAGHALDVSTSGRSSSAYAFLFGDASRSRRRRRPPGRLAPGDHVA